MPYIKKEERELIDKNLKGVIDTPGKMNYLISSISNEYGENYNNYNSVIGILECVKHEYYRRIVSKYEDKKMEIFFNCINT